MAFRTGRCTNDLFCSFASSQQDLQVPAYGNFVCPQCGKDLSDPPASAGRAGVRLALVAGGSLALGGAVLFLVGMFLGGRSTEPAAAATEIAATAKPAPAPVPAVVPAAGGDASEAPAGPQHEDAAALAAPEAPQAAPASPVVSSPGVMTAPAAAPASAPGTVASVAAPPPGAAAPQPEVHSAAAQSPAPAPTVQLAMVEQPRPQPVAPPVPQTDAADQARRAQEAADQSKRAQAQLEQARKAAAKAEQAKKAQLLAEQAKKEKALAEAKRERQEAQEEARRADEERAAREASEARAAQEQAEREQAAREQAAKALPPVAVAVAQPPAPKPAPVPSGPSRAFSASPVAGGAPPYPAELESDGRSGSVTVACRILEDGHPSGCRVVSARGGEPFKGAVLGWLNSGRVRYEPILHNGKPVVESHQWSVQFQPE